MKALTLTQPWASLVILGEKRFETRSWGTSYRGLVAIHAGSGFPGWARELVTEPLFREALGYTTPAALPLGAVLGTAHLVDVYEIRSNVETMSRGRGREIEAHSPIYPAGTGLYLSQSEHTFGDFTPGRFAWEFVDVVRFDEPKPAKGSLGLWEWNESGVSPEEEERMRRGGGNNGGKKTAGKAPAKAGKPRGEKGRKAAKRSADEEAAEKLVEGAAAEDAKAEEGEAAEKPGGKGQVLRRFKTTLVVALSDAEVMSAGELLAAKEEECVAHTMQAKATRQALADQEKSIRLEISRLAGRINTRSEPRDVEVEVRKLAGQEQLVEEVRTDTGMQVRVRPMTERESQGDLFEDGEPDLSPPLQVDGTSDEGELEGDEIPVGDDEEE